MANFNPDAFFRNGDHMVAGRVSSEEMLLKLKGAESAGRRVNNGAGYNAAATAIVVDDVSDAEIVPGRTVFIGDERVLIVAENSGSDTITVVRGRDGTTAADIDDDALIRPVMDVATNLAASKGEQLTLVNDTGTTASDTTVVVDDVTGFSVGDDIMIERIVSGAVASREILTVAGITTVSNTLLLVRGVYGTTAAAIADNSPIYAVDRVNRAFLMTSAATVLAAILAQTDATDVSILVGEVDLLTRRMKTKGQSAVPAIA